MYYVADTHAFLWYLADSPKLSPKVREIFNLCDQGKATVIIPAVVMLECIDVLDKKKVNLDFDNVAVKIAQSTNFIFSEINWSLILEVNKLKGLKDLHDRIIVTTAAIFDAYLLSKDRTIRKFYNRCIW